MRCLIACEFSGIVRDAFRARGHDAWSCDLLPCEADPTYHIQGDVLPLLNDGWDMMIAHPPCTYLSGVGNRHLKVPGRLEKRKEALEFFMQFVHAPIPRICVENPVGYPCSSYRKADQIIHPYMFGERALKRTCLWLKGLPPLVWVSQDDLLDTATATAYPEPLYFLKTTGKRIHHTEGLKGVGKERRGYARSKFWPSIAAAMAAQWG